MAKTILILVKLFCNFACRKLSKSANFLRSWSEK